MVGLKLESDSDYHLILSDGRWNLVAEIPSPACLPRSSVVREAVTAARQRLERALTSAGRDWDVITIAGVGFFDHEHHQSGAAWNQMELHPVTAICFGRDCTLGAGEPLPQVTETPEQIEEKRRREALTPRLQAICSSHAASAQAMQQYRSHLDSCRVSGRNLGYDCTEETS